MKILEARKMLQQDLVRWGMQDVKVEAEAEAEAEAKARIEVNKNLKREFL